MPSAEETRRELAKFLRPTDKGYRYKYESLAAVCQDISMGYSGAADPLPDDLLNDYVEWLQWRYDNWTGGITMLERIDAAYRMLVKETLELHVRQTL